LYSKLQKIAYHEAAHAVAFIHVGEPFEFIQIIVSPREGDVNTPLGRVHFGDTDDQREGLWRLFTVLAGPAAEKHMRPSMPWNLIFWNGARNDYKQAWEIAEQLPDKGRFVDDMLRTTMLRFVRNEWDRIVKLGNALLSAPGQTLTYEECLTVLGYEPNIASWLASRMSQSPRPESVN
jgi:hypothetical protein